jgi:uncharacterized protein YbjT (DUF2867 family)
MLAAYATIVPAKPMERRNIFLSGGTGYIGKYLSTKLLERGHRLSVLARSGSEAKVQPGAAVVAGDALKSSTFGHAVESGSTFVHLTGVAHPAPWKEAEFRAIDLVSLQASSEAACAAGVAHFVYVSVAHPAPAMKAYIEVRMECEQILANTGLPQTILRPWYVLGPGHRWPVALRPIYALLEANPSTRVGALRLGLVTLQEMTSALVWAVENPAAEGSQIMDVPAIRAALRQ